MGLLIPAELAGLLDDLGYAWPEVDEAQLFDLGRQWMSLAATMDGIRRDADSIAEGVTAANSGGAVDAFTARWQARDSASAVLRDGVRAACLVGTGLFICAGVVLALKINMIVQLTVLLIEITAAIAAAAETLGASLLELPAARKRTDIAINLIVNAALEAILG
jgi:hypothetical protein